MSALLLVSACHRAEKNTSMQEEMDLKHRQHEHHEMMNQDEMSMGNLENARGTQEDLLTYVGDKVYLGDKVYFNFNSFEIESKAQETLKRQAKWLHANHHVTIEVEGHCDERGTRDYNLALGERRANSVKKYLVSLGVPAHRISMISYGKEHPVSVENNEAGWAKNRRSVTVVTSGL